MSNEAGLDVMMREIADDSLSTGEQSPQERSTLCRRE